MIKKISTIVIILFAFAGMSNAQVAVSGTPSTNGGNMQSANANANANITIYQALTANQITGEDMNFGSVPAGVTATVDPTKSAAAGFHFVGASNASVNITYPTTVTLSDQSGNGYSDLTLASLQVVYDNSSTPDQANGTVITATGSETETLGSGGDLYMWVGGSVTVPGSQQQAPYKGTLTVNISYTAN
ncbi:MAG TPA: DUF4402 domain-containing protein [Balneolales bacterium]|nr:DUF4402 domain-containing protein [Balneolales bacterium]